jgi:hypothetical protein
MRRKIDNRSPVKRRANKRCQSIIGCREIAQPYRAQFQRDFALSVQRGSVALVRSNSPLGVIELTWINARKGELNYWKMPTLGELSMLGIMLTPEQIRTAPVEVRRWIEQEIAKSIGLRSHDPSQLEREHLVGCTPEVARTVLSLIRGMLPVVNVFFELGRKGTSLVEEGLEAFRLADMKHHTRLPSLDQVIACLDVINDAVRRATGDITATLYVVDNHGDCFIAIKTQQSVLRVWQEAIAGQAIGAAPEESARGQSVGSFADLSGPGTFNPDSREMGPRTTANN